MKLSQKAQHTLEYMILLTLIMAGIIIGGPYAIRSWNAHIKSWEDSVVDSFNEPLTEAPPGTVDIGGCSIGPWQPGACGPANSQPDPCTGQTISCPERSRIYFRTFSPDGCQCRVPSGFITDPKYKCESDNNSPPCCTAWVTPSGCFPDTDPNCPREPNDCGVNVGCPNGQYRRTHTCNADGFVETGCVPHPTCVFTCQGPHAPGSGPPYGNYCDAQEEIDLTNDTSYTYLNPNAPCTANKCEIKCNSSFTALDCDASGRNCRRCDCAPPYARYGNVCCAPPMIGNSTGTACIYPPPRCQWNSPVHIHWGADQDFGCRQIYGPTYAIANHDGQRDNDYDRRNKRQCCEDLSKIENTGNCQWTGWRKAGNWINSPQNMLVDETQTCRNFGTDYVLTNIDCGINDGLRACRSNRIECCQVTNPNNTYLTNCQWTPNRHIDGDQDEGCREYFGDQYVAVGFDCVYPANWLCRHTRLRCCQLIKP